MPKDYFYYIVFCIKVKSYLTFIFSVQSPSGKARVCKTLIVGSIPTWTSHIYKSMNYNQQSIDLHRQSKGKIEIRSKVALKTRDDLSLAYTPGVGAVCRAIGDNKEESWNLTNRANQVAIVSDGTAILGLGNLGPEAAMPVIEGKAIIFKEFAGIDAIPLCINAKTADEIVNFCKAIEPSFAGINLEDIAAPVCFDVLERLEKELSIPVFHDDQYGTAIVVLAGLINAFKLLNKDLKTAKIVINGAGAAGIAIAKLLFHYGCREILVLDSQGVLSADRSDLNFYKKEILKYTNLHNFSGKLADAMIGANIFIGVSRAGVVSVDMIKSMVVDSVIFAMANPVPEIMPDEALSAGAAIVGTGRSDFPNQINNALVFPGLFKLVLDNKIKDITVEIMINVAMALANSIEPSREKLLPFLTEKIVVDAIVNTKL